jgi:hypothetical protein
VSLKECIKDGTAALLAAAALATGLRGCGIATRAIARAADGRLEEAIKAADNRGRGADLDGKATVDCAGYALSHRVVQRRHTAFLRLARTAASLGRIHRAIVANHTLDRRVGEILLEELLPRLTETAGYDGIRLATLDHTPYTAIDLLKRAVESLHCEYAVRATCPLLSALSDLTGRHYLPCSAKIKYSSFQSSYLTSSYPPLFNISTG